MILNPMIEGSLAIKAVPGAFESALRRRVTAGLLSGHPHPRSNYALSNLGPHQAEVAAADWWTAINVGLNRVTLRIDAGIVHYRVVYWRWASYVLALCGLLGLVSLAWFLLPGTGGILPGATAPAETGLTLTQYYLVAIANSVFWGLIFPWILIVLHKGRLRRLMMTILTAVDSEALGA